MAFYPAVIAANTNLQYLTSQAYWNPSLDTVAQPVEQFAQKTADALMQMLTEQKTSHTVLECSLINRGSCRANP